jgi:hypothetical protein
VDSESNCSISGTTLTVATRGDGACVVLAQRASTLNYFATSATVTVTIDKAVQSGFAARINGFDGDTVAYTSPTLATAILSTINNVGGGTVNFAEDDVDCVVGTGSVTISQVGNGACLLTATSAASENYLEATDTVLLTIIKGSQSISFAALADKTYGDDALLLEATSESGEAFVFNTTDGDVCTINNATNELTIVGVGTCTLTVDQSGNTNYFAAARVTDSFTVVKSAQEIAWETIDPATYGQLPFLLEASATSGGAMTYTSSTPLICTVSTATLTIVTAGSCTVTADQAGTANYLAATQYTQTFTIAKATQTIDFGLLTTQTLGALPFTVSATASSGLTVSFSSQTGSVCTVSGSTVTLIGGGTCTIRPAQSGNDNYLAAANNDRSFSVIKGSQVLSFTSVPAKSYGDPAFTVTATSTAGLTPSYTGSTPTICSISLSGTVTINRAGACTIAAAQAGNDNYKAASTISLTITIAKAVQTITFDPLTDQTLGAANITLSATSTSGLAVTFASKTTAVCTVFGSTLTVLTAGTCTITASQSGNLNNNNAVPVDRSFTVSAAPQTIDFTQPVDTTYDTGATTLVATASSGLGVEFASTTPLVCTVSGDVATFADAGTCTVSASQEGSLDYAAATSVTYSFAIAAGVQVIEFDPLGDLTFGAAAFDALAFTNSGRAVTFASSTTGICTTTVNGTITIVGAGTCTITASAAAGGGYAAADAVDQSFTVAQASQATLTLTASPTVIALSGGTGTTTLTGVGGTGGGALTYSVVSGSGCSIATATLTATTVGTCVVKVTRAASANYLVASSANLSITVQAVPVATGSALAITGTKGVGQTLSLTVPAGTWTGTPTPTLSYQWFTCTSADSSNTIQTGASITGCTAISGATTLSYKLPASGLAANYRIRVMAQNTIGGTVFTAYAWSKTK